MLYLVLVLKAYRIRIELIRNITRTAAGLGLALSSFSLAINSYFKEKRNKAAGISMTLTGLGPILYPPLITALLFNYGVSGCVLIMSAICTHVIMAALLLQPVKWHMIAATNSAENDDSENQTKATPMLSR